MAEFFAYALLASISSSLIENNKNKQIGGGKNDYKIKCMHLDKDCTLEYIEMDTNIIFYKKEDLDTVSYGSQISERSDPLFHKWITRRWLCSIYQRYWNFEDKKIRILIQSNTYLDGLGDVSLFTKIAERLKRFFPFAEITGYVYSSDLSVDIPKNQSTTAFNQIKFLADFSCKNNMNIVPVMLKELLPSCPEKEYDLEITLLRGESNCKVNQKLRLEEYETGFNSLGLGSSSLGIFIDNDIKNKPINPYIWSKYELSGYLKYYVAYMPKNDYLLYNYLISVQYLNRNTMGNILVTIIKAKYLENFFDLMNLVEERRKLENGTLLHITTKNGIGRSYFEKINIKLDLWIFLPGFISHDDLVDMIKFSGEIVGCTGDQSFSEVISAGKIPIYDMVKWPVWVSYVNICILLSDKDKAVINFWRSHVNDQTELDMGSPDNWGQTYENTLSESVSDKHYSYINGYIDNIFTDRWRSQLDNFNELSKKVLKIQEEIAKYFNVDIILKGELSRMLNEKTLSEHEQQLFNDLAQIGEFGEEYVNRLEAYKNFVNQNKQMLFP